MAPARASGRSTATAAAGRRRGRGDLRAKAPFTTGVRYGPLRMARMITWSVIGRLRSRRAG